MRWDLTYNTEMHSFSGTDGVPVCLTLYCTPLTLNLRSAFGTSHSSTTQRTNALFRVSVHREGCGEIIGYGECGLPPKKPPMYLVDYNDVSLFVEGIALSDKDCLHSLIDGSLFDALQHPESDTVELAALRLLLHSVDLCGSSSHSTAAARSGIECAVLDCWGKCCSVPLYCLIGALSAPRPVFFTTALNTDLSRMEDSARFGLKHTPYIKIKMDGDYDKCVDVLAMMSSCCPADSRWVIDANAAWTPETANKMLDVIVEQYRGVIWAVEQPFPMVIEDMAEWVVVKDRYGAAGLLIFSDESVRDVRDIDLLKPICHGVNIKLDKAGGHRAAVTAVCRARDEGLYVWIGMMVGSCLASASAAHMLPLALCGDLDGALLVRAESQADMVDHIEWRHGRVVLPHTPHESCGIVDSIMDLSSAYGGVESDRKYNGECGVGIDIKVKM